jgi:hypothetical protein
MTKFVTPKQGAAEGIYPAMPMQNAQTVRVACSSRDREMPRDHTGKGSIFQPKSTL